LAGGEILFASALTLEDEGKTDEALEQYRRLLACEPRHGDAWHNQGLLLARLGRYAEAEESHRRYVAALPDSSRAHADLADVLLARERYDEALREAGQAARLDPRAYLPCFTAGLAASMTMRFEDGDEWFRRARRSDPVGFQRFLGRHAASGALDRDLDPRAIYLLREFDRLEHCDWSRRDAYVDTFRSLIETGDRDGRPICSPPLVFRSFHLPLPLETRRKLADNVARRFIAGAAPLRASLPSRPFGGRPIRIGYVSSDFRTHPTAILGEPLFRLHDRSRFEVHAFSLGLPDESRWYRAIRSNSEHFHDLSGLALKDVAARVRAAAVDILVDLNGVTSGALPELFAARGAPVQVSYLAFPGTSGAGLVDYLICDDVCVPQTESSGYSEDLIRLPHTFWIGDPERSTCTTPSRASHGLPEEAVVLSAHHPGRKIHPEIFSAWMDILAAVPASVLWLLFDYPLTRENLIREAAKRGVCAERLVFAPRVPHAEHQARIRLADLALDTPVCNGGTTTLDALAAGIPVVTCPAPGFAGRMTASALRAAALGDLIFPDVETYTSAVIQLATDGESRVRLSDRARQARSSALFDAGRRVAEIEAAYERLVGA
jgi:tetratricopeptide (TPR) repeat protein